MDIVKKILIVSLTMLMCDGIWLGVIAPKFYYENLKHLTRGVGKIDVHVPAAVVVYVILILAFLIFLAPIVSPSTWPEAVIKSFLLGIFIYGVYDFTNLATLKDWPMSVSLADTVWGGVLFSITGSVFKFCVEQGWIARTVT